MVDLKDIGFYCVQEIKGDYVGMSGCSDDEREAVQCAKEWLREPWFEGDSVRVMTIDSELVGIFTRKDV